VDPRPTDQLFHLERYEGGVRISGQLRTPDAEAVVTAIRDATPGSRALEIDLTEAQRIDGGVIALLNTDLSRRGVRVAMRGPERVRSVVELWAGGEPTAKTKEAGQADGLLVQTGRATVEKLSGVRSSLVFVGQMTSALGRFLRRPPRSAWSEAAPLVGRTGPDALPIVLVINFLVGLVIAYMSARELERFAANIYVADLIGVAMTRQLGPLMTAILVSGRSGAAFATELGSMKVSEEIDALRTLGLEPFGWLVLPRVLTLMLILPVLTLLADVVGIFGGLVIAVTSLDVTPQRYFKQMQGSLTPFDVWSGLLLSVAFAIAIGFIACQQGFSASGGPQGVGRRTTTTVVYSIFAIVLIDSAFTIFFHIFNIG
jgi:phospholipid/cholesterol/gamma-HCH transport system permease protein